MGAKDLQKKLKKKKNIDEDSRTVNSSLVQNEENFPKVTKEKKKKKNLKTQNRGSKDEIGECHLSYHKDASDNADRGKKKSKSSKQKKRKNDELAESGGADQSNEIEDGLGQENTISSESGNQETTKSKKKKRKSDKRAGKIEANGVPKRKRGTKEAHEMVEKDRPFSVAEHPEEREQAEEEEIYELSSGDEDYSKGMRKWVTDYYQSMPGLKVLQERIDEFITDHEAKKEQEKKEKDAFNAEGGWTVVVHHKGRKKTTDSETGIAVGSVSQAAAMDNMTKKKKKDVGLDFYRFQKREAKRNEIMVLQSKFEQDKKRIQQLRAARKFRPY